jgi:hypothetical protein
MEDRLFSGTGSMPQNWPGRPCSEAESKYPFSDPYIILKVQI